MSALSPPPPLRGTSPSRGGNASAHYFFPPKRGKWLSVSETEGGEARTRARAKSLRKRLTDAETILWSRLRKRQLGGHHIRRQHPIGPYIADFACLPLKLVIEVDGDTHTDPNYDARRTAFMESEGWTVLRVFNVDVYRNLEGVLDLIGTTLAELERAHSISAAPAANKTVDKA